MNLIIFCMEIFSVSCVNTDVKAGLSFSSCTVRWIYSRFCETKMCVNNVGKKFEKSNQVFLSFCLQLSGGCELTVVLQDFTAGCSTEMSVSTGERNLSVLFTRYRVDLPVDYVHSYFHLVVKLLQRLWVVWVKLKPANRNKRYFPAMQNIFNCICISICDFLSDMTTL